MDFTRLMGLLTAQFRSNLNLPHCVPAKQIRPVCVGRGGAPVLVEAGGAVEAGLGVNMLNL